ncbi:MAG TPA: NYN domain-containing protein [Acetobacteraceae bacterium]|nr:NYN domain-containing protein [Acetobacteraceae bacterium]
MEETPCSTASSVSGLETMRKLAAQRVAVLIDDDNLSIQAANAYGRRIDYAKLLEAIDDREIVRAILYRPEAVAAQYPFPPKLQHFLERRLGVEVKTPPKNVDCWLTVDAIALANKVDVVALVGGDGDYEPLLHYLKAQGCKVEVWSWMGCTSKRLREAADRYIPLNTEVLLPAVPAAV